MTYILLTKDQGAFLGPIANILGMLMDAIFKFLDWVGLPNTGLSIILFTILIYIAMLPLTIRQQKFSKLQAVMAPELQAIRDKYKGKKDQASMQAMNAETQAVHARYGVSQMGSCLQLIIQMPILFALYRVINNMPAYVAKIKEAFFPLVDKLIAQPGSKEFISGSDTLESARRMFTRYLGSDEFIHGAADSEYVQNVFVDVLNRASTGEFLSVATEYPALAADVENTMGLIERYNNFLGINIGNSPSFMVTEAWNAVGGIAWISLLAAFIIPVLSAVTQWLNVKLMPQQAAQADGQPSQMQSTMKTMNTMMPLMSAFFCFTLPAGMGLYWVAGAVVRSIQQVIINRHFDKMDLDELIRQNVEKRKKKMEKRGVDANKMSTIANASTRNAGGGGFLQSLAEKAQQAQQAQQEIQDARAQGAGNAPRGIRDKAGGGTASGGGKDGATESSAATGGSNVKPGGIAAKANMVREYNERSRK